MNNEAPELSAEARRIISAARGCDDPTQEDHDRVKTRWLAGVAALAGVSSLAEAARAAGGIGWGIKAAASALVLVAGAVGVYLVLPGGPTSPEPAGVDQASARDGKNPPAWLGVTHERHEKTAAGTSARPQPAVLPAPSSGPPRPAEPVVASVEVAQPAPSGAVPDVLPSAEVAGEASVVEELPARQPAAAAHRRAKARAVAARAPKTVSAPAPEAVAAAAAPSGQLGEELALLSEVRSSVQGGTPARALDLLSQYETRFGRPILEMEADALRVDALCRSGQREAARESARTFQNEWPGSPLGRRVSSACP